MQFGFESGLELEPGVGLGLRKRCRDANEAIAGLTPPCERMPMRLVVAGLTPPWNRGRVTYGCGSGLGIGFGLGLGLGLVLVLGLGL